MILKFFDLINLVILGNFCIDLVAVKMSSLQIRFYQISKERPNASVNFDVFALGNSSQFHLLITVQERSMVVNLHSALRPFDAQNLVCAS